MMQAMTIILCTALILGFLVLFLAPGRWWPRRPPQETRQPRPPGEDEPPEPPCYTGYPN